MTQQFFHGVKGATLDRLIAQSDDGHITLWGRVVDEEGRAGYECGAGELSVTDAASIEVSFHSFCDEDGMVLILEPITDDPSVECHNQDEYLIKAEEWRVAGGLRPVYTEVDEEEEWPDEPELIDQQEFSLEEILAL